MVQSQINQDVDRLKQSLGSFPEAVASPAFVVVSGLPGTGKSYFCSRLAERASFCVLESDALFHVSSTKSDYTSPFPLSSMGTLAQIQKAIGPDGKTPLGDCTVDKIRLAIGNWGPGGPTGPVICYVDCLTCNEEIRF